MADPTKNRKLTPKQSLFVKEYLIDLNATDAAIRAGYSKKTAGIIGHQLLNKTLIKTAIQEAMDKRSQRTDITADNVLNEIANLSFSDVRNVFCDKTGQLLPVHKMPKSVTASISSIKVVSKAVPGTDPVEIEYISEVKFWDKKGSLELLGKHLKLFNEVGSKENPLHIDKLSDEALEARLKALEAKD